MPGKDDIYWRRRREELLGSDLLLFAGEAFASENSIVSELGWDLSLALKGLSLGNEINKRPVLASQRAMMWQLTKENREGAVGDIAALFLRPFKNCIDAHGGQLLNAAQVGSPVLPCTLAVSHYPVNHFIRTTARGS